MKKVFTILVSFYFSFGLNSQDFIPHELNGNAVNDYAIIDFDNDGDMEIFGIKYIWGEPNAVIKMTNKCEIAPLSFEQEVKTGIEANRVMTSGDFDGNGYVDLMLSIGFTQSSMWFYKNDGTGTFEAIDLGFKNIEYTETFDFDSDGDIDLMVKDVGANFKILVNDGSGSFTIAKSFTLRGDDSQFKLADFDNDGNLDIVLGDDYFHKSKLYLFHNKGNFQFDEYLLDADANEINQLQIADIDRDGNMDIMLAEDDYFNLYINNGNNQFTKNHLYKRADITGYYSAIALTDIDYDGDIDILLCDWGEYNNNEGLILYKNSGDFQYDNFKKTVLNKAYSSIIGIEDFTCDGKNDIFIVVGNFVQKNVILENNIEVNSINESFENIQYFPNPVIDKIYFKTDDFVCDHLSILDLNGRVVREYKDLKQNSIDVSDLKPGFYIVNVSSGNAISNSKFIKK